MGRVPIVLLVSLAVLFCLCNFLLHFLVTDASLLWFSPKSQPSGDGSIWGSMDVPESMRDRLAAKNSGGYLDASKCNMHSCFDIKRCSHWSFDTHAFQSVSLPNVATRAGKSNWHSSQFDDLLRALKKEVIAKSSSTLSGTHRDDESCIAIPNVDLLDENRNLPLEGKQDNPLSLPKNSLVFNLVPNATRGYFHSFLGYAMVASSGLLLSGYRKDFDISIPFYSPRPPFVDIDEKLSVRTNILLITASEDVVSTEMQRTTELKLCTNEVNHITHRCKSKSAKDADESETAPLLLADEMLNSEFCLLPERSWYRQTDLTSALSAGCIPVVTCDAFVLPFMEVIDWRSTALLYYGRSKSEVRDLIKEVKIDHINRLRLKGREVYDAYFSGLEPIVKTVFEIIHHRIDPLFHLKAPMTSSELSNWDGEQTVEKREDFVKWNSLFINNMRFMRHYTEHQMDNEKFTAVILTHDRVACLFDIVQTLQLVPGCEKVIVVWNNQQRQSPPQTQWPHVNKPLKVINMAANTLNNRFLPFKDISTDAVLSLDDDMNDVTVGEIMDAFRVWQLNPTRLVGFFGWNHFLEDNSVKSASGAESENLSAISTAVMFYHQAFAQLFVDYSNEELFEWIEKHENCEDIAFNFFVSNLTSLAPLQVKRNQEISAKSFCDMNKTDRPQKSKESCFQFLSNHFKGSPLKTCNFYVETLRSESFMFEEIEENNR